jgi:hypothetical protein
MGSKVPKVHESEELFRVVSEGYQPPARQSSAISPDPTPPWSFRQSELMLLDHQVQLGCSIKAALMLKPKIQLSGNPEIIQYLSEQIKLINLKMVPKVIEALWMSVDGGEMIYDRDPSGRVVFSEYRNFHPLDLNIIHKSFEFKGLTVRSRNQSIAQGTSNGKDAWNGAVTLMGPKAFFYVHKRRYGSWDGVSELRGAYKPWLSRTDFKGADSSARLWFYKNAFNGGLILHPPGSFKDTRTGKMIPYRDVAQQIGISYMNGGVITVENVVDPATKQPYWDIKPPTMNGSGEDLLNWVDHLDVRIHRGMGIPDDILSQESGTGSYAGRTIPLSAFGFAHTQQLRAIWYEIDVQILRYLVATNFGNAAVNSYKFETVECDLDALMPKGPGQAGDVGPMGDEENQNPLNLDEPPPPPEETQQFSDDDHPRAPRNGVIIGGKKYEGGEYIPKEVISSMTADQRSRLADAMDKSPSTQSQHSVIDINVNDTTPDPEPKKQLHEMTLAEFTDDARKEGVTSDFKDRWRSSVRRAMMRGDKIPDDVREEYDRTTPEHLREYKANIPDPTTAKQDFDHVPVTEKFDPRDPVDDGYYYHITTKGAATKILKKGLVPNSRATMDEGSYREYSKGKVFLTDRGGVNFWKMTVENHLNSQGRRATNLVVLRVPKQAIGKLDVDELGTRDAPATAYYSTEPVVAGKKAN